MTADWSLADHEGGEGYGIIQAKIALLTQTMYEKYADQDLLELDDWWWLITPNAGSAGHARSVGTGGSLNCSYAYGGYRGVRPAFFVESGIALSVEPDQVELSTSALLAEFTSEQLVEEVIRRIAEGQEDGDDDEEDDF